MSSNTSPQPQGAGLKSTQLPPSSKAKNITLFVGNLSTEVDEPYLRRLFAAYTEVKRVCVYRQPELYALIEVTSYDDADTAIAALHCRYCMAPNVPILVFYHKSNAVVSAYGKTVWRAYVAAASAPGGMNALYREALDSKGLGDVKQDGSTCPPPGAPLMMLPRAVALESYDPQLPRKKPPTIPPDIIQLGKMYLQNELSGQRGGDRGGRGGSRGRFTQQFTTSLIPGVDAPTSGLNRHRGARGRGGPSGMRGGGAPFQRGGMGYPRGGLDMYGQHHHHSNGMYGQVLPQYSPQHHHQQEYNGHQQHMQHHHQQHAPYGGGYGMPPGHMGGSYPNMPPPPHPHHLYSQ